MMHPLAFWAVCFGIFSVEATSQPKVLIASPAALASQYALTTSTSLAFPTATLAPSDTEDFIVSSWNLNAERIEYGSADLAFVPDPFTNASSSTTSSAATASSTPPSPVLRVTYPSGSYSHDTGGAQFYALWNASNSTGAQFTSMLLTYEVAFDSDFDWVKGGKLPGLRGGADAYGCSGGQRANGSNCFSTRVMWRPEGEGEGMSRSCLLLYGAF
ncbi:uncharacterized protein FIBRA_03518 [Fibroporia radiculosa]|uniref:Polysaccharide lyase 14 domain-containing protein n=1 Tax=Fibroporia radiculosa TaxID=599839 RepID=J4H2G1_9APHY|nr:uncharacterized protein FIBRA_03518 [Fibroporia radiculosa]CCM01464.1 predicted protein [Fibroporia radiculosa]